MSLSQYPDAIETGFTINTDGRGDQESVLVGKDLWNSVLASFPLLNHQNRFVISIAPRRPPQSSRFFLPCLICWAIVDERTTNMSIPSRWLKIYDPIFLQTPLSASLSENTLLVAVVQPVLLTEVIVTALSSEAYRVANAQDAVIEDWLSRNSPILRQGDLLIFNSDLMDINGQATVKSRQAYRYRLDMVEPVLQGYARKGDTRFVFIAEDALCEDIYPSDRPSGDELESDMEGIEIDESFLASSILSSPSIAPTSFQEVRAYTMNNSADVSSSSNMCGIFSEAAFLAEPLPGPVDSIEDDYTVYLRTADLSRVGVLSGHWAVSRTCDALKYRLVRVVALDDSRHTTGVLLGSPLLLHNISGETSTAPTVVSLQASPFGSLSPTIPVAKAVTVARVASPFSMDRNYQPLFLHALKSHFAGIRRLVKQGDLIAIGIDAGLIHQIREIDSKLDGMVDTTDFNVFEISFPVSSIHHNETVFFIITNVEHDVFSSNASTHDMYVGSAVGELGCWIDSTITRIIQTGVEHSRVPIVEVYMGIGTRNLQMIQQGPSSCLLRHGSAFSKVFAISSATLVRRAVDCSLPLSLLLKGARGTGKFTIASWVAQRLGMHLLEVNCYDIVGENDAQTEGTLRARFDKANACSPCIFVLRHVEALVQTTQTLQSGKESPLADVLQECIGNLQEIWTATGYPVLVFATTAEPERVPIGILSCFKHEVTFEPPCESDRYDILSSLLAGATLSPDVSLSSIATHTAALVASDLADLVARVHSVSIERVTHVTNCKAHLLTQAGIPLTAADFDVALGKARASYSESIGAPKIPNVTWDDIGGLAHVKSDILDTIQLPLEHPELFADGLKKRSGILLYGPPGTGKTLLAKAVATSCSLNFFSVKGPELLNMYIGESEANVRRVFQRARSAKPCVIFFDELDSVAPKRGNLGDSGGVMDRIVSQLLAELDGMSAGNGGADVFVIGATNRPDLLDPALLRPGRFDRMLYLGVSDTHEAQLKILEALTRKFRLHPGLDLSYVAEQCPFNYTGADFYALCSDAMLSAMSRKAAEIDAVIERMHQNAGLHAHPHPLTPQYYLAELASQKDKDILVSQEDFDLALRSLTPSVSQSDMDRYAAVRRQFSRETF